MRTLRMTDDDLREFIRNHRSNGTADAGIASLLNRMRIPGRLVWRVADIEAIAGPRRSRRKDIA